MSTPSQILANRKNAQRSTGPSEAGKAVSSMNNFKFGLTGDRFMLLEWEEEEEWDQLLSDLRQEHQPITPTEKILVEDMAKHHWLTLRARALQHFCFDPNNPVTGAEGYEAKLALYIRYETTHSRAFHKCLKELLSLREQKRKAEIGFESQNAKKQAQQATEYRRAKQEARHDELHQAKMNLLTAKNIHQQLKNHQLKTQVGRTPSSACDPLVAQSNTNGFVSQNREDLEQAA
jgi:hypothetical protein